MKKLLIASGLALSLAACGAGTAPGSEHLRPDQCRDEGPVWVLLHLHDY